MRRAFRAALVALAALAAGCRGDGGAAAIPAPDATAAPRGAAGAPGFGALEAAVDPGAQRISGRYREVRFAVERDGEAGATARFWIEGGPEVATAVEGPRRGELSWRGRRLRGGPPLAPADAAALDELARSPLAGALARVPLDLACRPGADELHPALGSALLLPWQMVLAYATVDVPAAVREAAGRSECQHFRGLSEPTAGRVPSPAVVALSFEAPLPVAAGYFPFDSGDQP